jgi:putative MATE family efflux protein
MKDTMIKDLTQGSVGKELLRFAFPFMLSNALQTVYSLVDMVVVGQFEGSAGLSAVSIGGQITWLLSCLAIGYASGGQIFISQLVGAGDHAGVRRTIGTLFSAVTIFSLIFTVLGIGLHTPLLNVLNTPKEAFSQAADYVVICSAGMFFVYGYNTVSAILRGMGDSTRPFIFIAIAAIMNVILDLILVGPAGMGAAGAALATTLSQAASYIISVIYLYIHRESFGFDFKPKSFAMDKRTFISLSKLGLPLTVQTTAINVSMLYVSAGVNSYGLVYSSVFGIGSKLNSLMFIITNSISTASASMFGQNLGAGKYDRIKKIFWFSNLYCMVFFLVVGTACLLFPEQIFRLFTQDEDVIAQAGHYILTLVVMFLGFASMTAGIALINGIGNGSLSLITALLDGVIVRIGLCVLLAGPCGMGVWGYFWGNALAGFVSTIIGDFYYLTGLWKKRKLMVDQKA